MNNCYKVYAHKNPFNGKVYIGCTKKSFKSRFDNGNGYKKCTRFWNDIIRYGFDNFEHILIKDNLTKEEAYSLEEVLIDTFDTMNPEHGYNMRRGGKHNIPCGEVGKAISASKMGHEVTEETRKKLREYGCRPVVQMDLDGEPIAIFRSMTDAANAVKGYKSNIFAVCSGRKPTSKGFKWAYYDE